MFDETKNRRIGQDHYPDKPEFHLPLAKAPDEIWIAIQAQLNESGSNQAELNQASRPQPSTSPLLFFRWAAAAALMVGFLGFWVVNRAPRPSWNVVRVQGTTETPGRFTEGEWLETNATSRARVDVGEIGILNVEPNSRLRLVAAKPGEHRLNLAHGEISAVISAPPRLFFVDTPSTTAVDLGCAYSMKTDDQGNGLLNVTSGWVSLESDGHDSLVPAGASCRTRRGRGPGTPFFSDASTELREALDAFDIDRSQLDTVLARSRRRDTLTLWHVLSKVEEKDRAKVFDRMVALVALPAGVTREKALRLDPDTLKHWREELAWAW